MALKNHTDVGLGFAIQSDPFQSGREAAQMAKSQMKNSKPNLILAFGPSHIHFQDFIEGVRLVTGEETLIGIPTSRIVSNEIFSQQACVVVILNSDHLNFSIAHARKDGDNDLAPVTTLFSQLRSQRGNTRHQYDQHGIFLIDNGTSDDDNSIPHQILTEAGLESWFLKFQAKKNHESPIICRDQALKNGMVAVECLSDSPWGFGVVDIEAFKNQPNIYNQAIKTALRDAHNQIKQQPPALGFLLLNFPTESLTNEDFTSIFNSSYEILHDMPLIGVTSEKPFLHCMNRSNETQDQSVIAVLIPK